jgi:hypothetical protein
VGRVCHGALWIPIPAPCVQTYRAWIAVHHQDTQRPSYCLHSTHRNAMLCVPLVSLILFFAGIQSSLVYLPCMCNSYMATSFAGLGEDLQVLAPRAPESSRMKPSLSQSITDQPYCWYLSSRSRGEYLILAVRPRVHAGERAPVYRCYDHNDKLLYREGLKRRRRTGRVSYGYVSHW